MATDANVVHKGDVGSGIESQAIVLIVDNRVLDLDMGRAGNSESVRVVTAALASPNINALVDSSDFGTFLVGQRAIDLDRAEGDVVAVADGEAVDWGVQDGDAFNVGIHDLFDAPHFWLDNALVSSATIPVLFTMAVNDATVETDNARVGR